MEEQSFDTREAILALSLALAGCEPLDEKQPCFNLFDEEILSKLGHRESVWDSAHEAWRQKQKGDVGYVFKMTPRLPQLVLAYREQCKQIEDLDMKSGEFILKIYADANAGLMQPDEMILRIACVILKTRVQYVNLWKLMVPLLRVPVVGKSKHFDTTAISAGKTVEAKGVKKPGFQIVSLNISEEHRKAIKL